MMILPLILSVVAVCVSADVQRVPSEFKDGVKWELTDDSRKGYARTSHYDILGTHDNIHVDVTVHPVGGTYVPVGHVHTPVTVGHIHTADGSDHVDIPVGAGHVHTPVGVGHIHNAGVPATGLLSKPHFDHSIGRLGYVHPHVPGTVGEVTVFETQPSGRTGFSRHVPEYVLTETHIPVGKIPDVPAKVYLPGKTVEPAKTYLPAHH